MMKDMHISSKHGMEKTSMRVSGKGVRAKGGTKYPAEGTRDLGQQRSEGSNMGRPGGHKRGGDWSTGGGEWERVGEWFE